jgi:LEA14-like dessication related protein
MVTTPWPRMRWSLPAGRGGRLVAGSVGTACWLMTALGCTPLGGWVYSDPALEVGRVRLAADGSSSRAPVLVALTVRNPNDYDLSSDRLELALRLDDMAVGEFARDSTVPLPKSATAVVVLPLQLSPGTTREHLAVLSHGTRHFSVTGRAQFRTPFGPRIVRFAGEGVMVFGGS